jgi:nucleotide-binding universal stress UspA family protein
MNTILVPTDFSGSAENAMYYAAQLAQSINASVFLFHIYQLPVSMSDTPVLMVSAEELKQSADTGLERAKELLLKNYSTLDIKTESRLGDLTDELNDLCDQINPFAIVVGNHSASGFERFFFGSSALSIIRHAKVPVIAVPNIKISFQAKNIALAVDDSGLGNQQDIIKNFVEQLKAQLHIINVQTKDNTTGCLELLPELNPSCHTIKDEDFVHGIQSYLQSNNIDLLMILPHKHSLVERLLFKTHTAELLEKLQLPIISIS